MDFKQLFNTQAELDAAIIEKHPELKGQDNLDWKVLALQVELGELANEWRGFKKWSNDQEPRKVVRCNRCVGKGMKYSHVFDNYDTCDWCNGTGSVGNPLLEEYADCLSFALTIGLELNTQVEHVYLLDKQKQSITRQISGLMSAIGLLNIHSGVIRENGYKEIFADLIRLGLKLGFTLDQIEAAYYDKNKLNHQRQASGY